jgi:hypothetical protein
MKIVLAALAACCVFCFAATLNGQTAAATPPPLLSDQSPTASILFPDGRSLPIRSSGGKFPLVIAYAGQTFTVQYRIPAAIASLLVIQPLDGGAISAASPVAADGTTAFQYQFGTGPGLYRIYVGLGNFSAVLQFWVPLTNGDNPPLLTPP